MVNPVTVWNEVDELRGRLSGIAVNYPDTEVRMRPAIDILDVLLTRPMESTFQQVVDELLDLRVYFIDILKKVPDLKPDFQPSVELIERLLGPSEGRLH